MEWIGQMSWMSKVFAVVACVYMVLFIIFAVAFRKEWREQCLDAPTWLSAALLTCTVLFSIGLVVNGAAAYYANGEWVSSNWRVLVICLAWLSIAGLGFVAYFAGEWIVQEFGNRRRTITTDASAERHPY